MNSTSPSRVAGRMRFRKLRIAFSATCLIACWLLIVLWVGSYWWIGGSKSMGYIKSIDRVLGVHWGREGVGAYLVKFDGNNAPKALDIGAPYWLLAPISVGLAIAPWIRWRFSLGALIIAMTLAAAVLGSAVYLLRN